MTKQLDSNKIVKALRQNMVFFIIEMQFSCTVVTVEKVL